MKEYVFIVGKKFDEDTDLPGLVQCYSTPETAQMMLDKLKKTNPSDYISNKIISSDEEWNMLPDNCLYIRAIEFLKG